MIETDHQPLKVDEHGRIIVIVVGAVAWVIDKAGRHHQLASPGEQLSRHVDPETDPVFCLMVCADKNLNVKH